MVDAALLFQYMEEVRFISIDQSTKATGWCLWINGEYVKHGIIDCSKITDSSDRFNKMSNEIFKMLEQQNPLVVWFEDTALQSNVKTLKELAQLQGIIIGYCLAKDIDYGIISPSQWRKLLDLPNGSTKKRPELKKNSINYVKENYNIETSEDECEAILIGAAVLKMFQEYEE